MKSSYTSRAADPPFALKFLVSYDPNRLLRTSSKDVEEISHFLSQFALGHLLGPLGPVDNPLPLQILVSYSLDIVVTKSIAYNEKFVY